MIKKLFHTFVFISLCLTPFLLTRCGGGEDKPYDADAKKDESKEKPDCESNIFLVKGCDVAPPPSSGGPPPATAKAHSLQRGTQDEELLTPSDEDSDEVDEDVEE